MSKTQLFFYIELLFALLLVLSIYWPEKLIVVFATASIMVPVVYVASFL